MSADESGRDDHHRYTVVLRATESQLRVPPGKGILLAPIKSDYGTFELRILTRTDNVPGIQSPLPRELWIEVTGPAPSLEVALNIAAATASDYVRQLAFGANAWQGLLSVHLGYDSTEGRRERTFFQNWVLDERGLPRPARQIDPDLMYRLLAALAQVDSRERHRILRAITQYTDALQHWKLGHELYALAHLYMGVEAITPTAIRKEISRHGFKRRRELETAVLHPPKLSILRRIAGWLYVRAGGWIRPPNLDTWARREVIFRGDEETFRTARTASDQLEHGLAQHEDVHQLAAKCVEKCAEYLRSFVLECVPLSPEDRAALNSKPYSKPARTSGLGRQLLATITSERDEIAAPEQAYPFVRWGFDLKDFRVLDTGSLEMQVTQKITPVIGEGAQFRIDQVLLAGPNETTHGPVEISVDRNENHKTASGIEYAVDDPNNAKWVHPLGSFILNCNAIRYLSVYWIIRLTGTQPQEIPRIAFTDLVEQIQRFISESRVSEQLRDECLAAWRQALDLDELREMLAGCTTQPDGLLPVDSWERGSGPLIGDVKKIVEMNDKAVEVAKTLGRLLDSVLAILATTIETPPELPRAAE